MGAKRLTCELHPYGSLTELGFVVTLLFDGESIWLSRHRERQTWETQGGHIEAGETVVQAAMRELYEESGATDYLMRPLCHYAVTDDDRQTSSGAVFIADLRRRDSLPMSEIAEVRRFDALPAPDSLTYPDITPALYARALEARRAGA